MHTVGLGRLTSSYTAENGVMVEYRKNFGGKQTFADYSYDNIGNVKHAEYKYDSTPYTFVDYNYDRYNQLTKEVHSPLSMGIDLRSAEYAYDEFGNITDVTRTDSSGKVTKNRYVYSDKTGWQDLLTSYNGHTITYDEIGNPLSYYNGKNYSFEWEAGRRLHSSASGGNSITAFADYVGDSKIYDCGAEYVAANYAWVASGWWWTENNMNALINSGGTVREITYRVRRNEEGWKDRQIIHDRIRAILG